VGAAATSPHSQGVADPQTTSAAELTQIDFILLARSDAAQIYALQLSAAGTTKVSEFRHIRDESGRKKTIIDSVDVMCCATLFASLIPVCSCSHYSELFVEPKQQLVNVQRCTIIIIAI
jgi:hypothetical protein